ncbi:hypothetical protein AMTR_s00006p00258600 [Amborella trichopoda]|uniref:ENT domain-containing protein n=2 Tax=Amborella trichopoda TaxID=13333 RepID=W1PDN0_AMBTC|nr:hypothetical protein AMTR_s00006p00258600 [Amborella trichopoda]
MDPVVETSPLQVPELKKCGSKKGRGKKHSLSPSSSLPPKGPEEPEEENDDCIIMEAIHAPEKTSRKRGRGTQLDKPVKTPTIRRAKMKAEDDGRMGVVAPSPGVNPSQNNKKSKTKTKDLVKKTKKGEDNGSTCMAALSSMVNLSQNSNKAKDFGEGETDGVKFDRVIVSIPQMGVSEKSRADNLTMLTGTCKDLSLAAYYLVLQALYLQGDPKWGHEVLLAELRTALAISNDEHVEELKRVTSNKFIATSFLKR